MDDVYNSLFDIDKKLLEKALEKARYYCCDAVNLVFEHHSSTSGMYPSWEIFVSSGCTVYIGKKEPMGGGETFNEALKSFIKSCEKNDEEFIDEVYN